MFIQYYMINCDMLSMILQTVDIVITYICDVTKVFNKYMMCIRY